MMRALRPLPLLLGAALALAGCGGGGGGGGGSASSVTNTLVPTPTASTKMDVTPCLNQLVAGRKLLDIVIPDVLTLDPTRANGFPNGRRLEDPVIDLELAALFLDLSSVPVDTLAKRPLNPSGNDEPYPNAFPWLAPAHGGVTTVAGGSGFAFRTDAASAYTRVDRMGEPAISTAVIATERKSDYNDDSPVEDARGKWAPVIVDDLAILANELQDDWAKLGYKICAVPKAS